MILAPDTIRPGMDMKVELTKLATIEAISFTARVVDNKERVIVGKTSKIWKGRQNGRLVSKIGKELSRVQWFEYNP